jgi:hypothetical protein
MLNRACSKAWFVADRDGAKPGVGDTGVIMIKAWRADWVWVEEKRIEPATDLRSINYGTP